MELSPSVSLFSSLSLSIIIFTFAAAAVPCGRALTQINPHPFVKMAEDIVQSAINNTLQNTVHDVLQNRRIHRSTDIETEGQEASRNVIETSVQEAGSIFISNGKHSFLYSKKILLFFKATIYSYQRVVNQ